MSEAKIPAGYEACSFEEATPGMMDGALCAYPHGGLAFASETVGTLDGAVWLRPARSLQKPTPDELRQVGKAIADADNYGDTDGSSHADMAEAAWDVTAKLRPVPQPDDVRPTFEQIKPGMQFTTRYGNTVTVLRRENASKWIGKWDNGYGAALTRATFDDPDTGYRYDGMETDVPIPQPDDVRPGLERALEIVKRAGESLGNNDYTRDSGYGARMTRRFIEDEIRRAALSAEKGKPAPGITPQHKELATAVAHFLEYMGTCAGAETEDGFTYCKHADCQYCGMARIVQRQFGEAPTFEQDPLAMSAEKGGK